jgi:hypothetical protein
LVLGLSREKREPAVELKRWEFCDRNLHRFPKAADRTLDVAGIKQGHATQLSQADVRPNHV